MERTEHKSKTEPFLSHPLVLHSDHFLLLLKMVELCVRRLRFFGQWSKLRADRSKEA